MLKRTAALLLVCGGLMTGTAFSQTRSKAPEERAGHLREFQAGEDEHVKLMPQPLQASATGRQPASIDEVFERRLLKETHGHGMFVDLHMGAAAMPTTIFPARLRA